MEQVRIKVGCTLIVFSVIGIFTETLYALLSKPINGLALGMIGSASLFAIGILMANE